ncbi:diaminopimelate epimerase [Cellulomonas bogoriensis]|uniref:Diaminopimelate epimerase n=1 Tax=Cellulomonas bogoriensis 69B4 = DSM 16987 TaxID=1386082 RepID=A0A0A0BNL5_9CELL|nr:diaminopimelate epimerase [Cellulomonas bogoriensis]KGM09561.1 diaminopimelate epimerase [Cellulomonas bogoriensis 69B4 = DSM 16987]
MTTSLDGPTAGPSGPTLRVTKGHGTENDFVLLADPDGALDLDAPLVRALADRRAGLGGDGVIRLVRSTQLPQGRAALERDGSAEWFMDYRNGDGSVAEMCGNGVRVAARFAEDLGVWDGRGSFALATRAGVRHVRKVDPPRGCSGEWYAVDMGPWRVVGGPAALERGGDVEVRVAGLPVARPGLSVDVGNPHTVVVVADEATLAGIDLTGTPRVDPEPPSGTNVELVVPLGEAPGESGPVGRVRMRVHERGVGETRSCGTGACAAAMAVAAWAGPSAPSTWLVDVPGGTVRVRSLERGRVELAGPAVLVARAEVDLTALRGA